MMVARLAARSSMISSKSARVRESSAAMPQLSSSSTSVYRLDISSKDLVFFRNQHRKAR